MYILPLKLSYRLEVRKQINKSVTSRAFQYHILLVRDFYIRCEIAAFIES